MNTHNFELKEGHEYIQLNNLLQYLSIAQTGGHAKILIQNEEVLLNGVIETRIRKKIFSGDVVQLESIEVSVK
ncbi:MAG: RNA-binding S4 domain-containing protein [Flavobacteriaceae bacterium]|nr:RNA-binding S4 domain-containing protein [Flavobacteriaceae bacterium]